MRNIKVEYPGLQILKSDNGRHFTANDVKAEADALRIKLATGLAYNPQGQGSVERSNRTLKIILLGLMAPKYDQKKDTLNKNEVDLLLIKAVNQINRLFVYTLGSSPNNIFSRILTNSEIEVIWARHIA